MPVDQQKINALFERIQDRDPRVQAAALSEAATLRGPEMTALLKPYGPKFPKFTNGKGEEWYINENSWSLTWSNGGAELFFNRPGKSWARKRDSVRRLIWNGQHTLDSVEPLLQLQNLE